MVYLIFTCRLGARFHDGSWKKCNKRQVEGTLGYILYRIALAPTRNPHRMGLQFTHEKVDIGVGSTPEQGCTSAIIKVNRDMCDSFLYL